MVLLKKIISRLLMTITWCPLNLQQNYNRYHYRHRQQSLSNSCPLKSLIHSLGRHVYLLSSDDFDDDDVDDDDSQLTIEDIADLTWSKVVSVWPSFYNKMTGVGTGCIIDMNYRFVVTNCHVCEDLRDVRICYHLFGDTELWCESARILYVEPQYDLSLLLVNRTDSDHNFTEQFDLSDTAGTLPTAEFGQQVVCMGYPDSVPMTTVGWVCCPLSLQITGRESDNPFVQHTSVTKGGFSGGPLVDELGDLVGVHHSGLASGFRFATPYNVLKEFYLRGAKFYGKQLNRINELKSNHQLMADLTAEHRYVDRTLLGVEICWFNSLFDEDYKEYANREGHPFNDIAMDGILVWSIFRPNHTNRDLHVFDVIIGIDDLLVVSIHDLSQALTTNSTIKLSIIRDGMDEDISVTTEQMRGLYSIQ